ncbi:MAG: AarF/ABC1/UbiB kinase family protein [Symploca sp. SIO3C6]|nr:AarF/ABC1/UbiB kinase family protein [Symploca sp. SIO3C6]
MSLAKSSSRQAEIVEVVFRRGWDYMRRLLSGGKTDEPEIPPPAVLRNILTDLGPVYVKLGQLLSTRPDLLPPAYIEALSSLQSKVPPVDASEMEGFIRQQLPSPPEKIFAKINYQAIAAGSIAQTHRATLKDGREVAIKVQRPGIELIVARDIALIKNVARLVGNTEFGQRYNVVSLADEFSRALQAELDFTQEASYTDQLRANLSQSRWFDPKRLLVPEVFWDLTRPKIMVLEWLDGVPILSANLRGSGYGGNIDAERQAITTVLFQAFFQQYLSDGFFHADPHPGNIFYLSDGRVAILDCGMMGSLDPRTRTTLMEMMLAMVSCDAQRCTQLTLQIAEPMQSVDLLRLQSDYNRLLGRYANLSLARINTAEAFNEIMEAASRNYLRWPANIGLFAKSLANLEGVARQFYPAVNLFEEVKPLMSDLFRQQLIGDDPLQAAFRTAIEFKSLSLESPRQLSFLLDRLSNETLQLNLKVHGIDGLRRSIDDAANRRTFGTVVSALIIGAAIVASGAQTSQLQLLSDILFAVASFLGFWLIIGILRSGRLR